jgi:hypothetical protein
VDPLDELDVDPLDEPDVDPLDEPDVDPLDELPDEFAPEDELDAEKPVASGTVASEDMSVADPG